jgi:glycerophosphoryl diester phosphodiesterase
MVMEWLIAIIIISIIMLILIISFPHREGKDLSWMKGYCAHRGLHNKEMGVEENSPSAFQLAIDAGLNIEMDIRMTKDGIPIVFHDADGRRMLNIDENIENLTLEEVRSAYIGNSLDKVMTFREFLEMVSGKVGLIIEIKATSQNERVSQLCAEILDGYSGDFSICSFRPEILRWFAKNRKHFIRGQLIENILDSHQHSLLVRVLQSFNGFAFVAKPNYLTVEYRHAEKFRWIRLFNGFLCVWTIRDRNWMDQNSEKYDAIIFENVKI